MTMTVITRKYLDQFIEYKENIKEQIKAANHELSYKELLEIACNYIKELDQNKITMIDDGDYQGTLIFAIPEDTYQPSFYEYVFTYVYYGSCSVCDTIMRIYANEDENERVDSLYTVALHMVERMRKAWGDYEG